MNDLSTDRTPPVIAAEINTIRHQTRKILLAGAIEIGRRLKEAKDLLPHGEWGKWLKESVSHSQRTADKLMQLCEEYRTKLLASPDSDGNPNSSLVTNLTYTQALILLGILEEKRDEFIAEHDVKSMTKLELQQYVDKVIIKDIQDDVTNIELTVRCFNGGGELDTAEAPNISVSEIRVLSSCLSLNTTRPRQQCQGLSVFLCKGRKTINPVAGREGLP